MDEKKQDKDDNNIKMPQFNKKLLELARKQRMNTDTRRTIFCIIMSAEVCFFYLITLNKHKNNI